MCEVQGWTPAGFYVDNDRSATNGKERPEWARLLADVEDGAIDAIVVWNQDRGWRKMADLESLRPVLEPRGVPLATTNIGVIDFRNADDVFRAQISTAMSEMEVAKMKVRMRRAARQKAEKGLPQWKRAFGYLDDTRTPDPRTAPLVAQAYAAIIAGASLGDVCRLWNDAGALTQRWVRPKDADGKPIPGAAPELEQRPWTQPQVSNFLRKPRNAGLRAHNGQILGKGTWDALVDEPTWRQAQAVLNAPGRAPGRKSVRRHLLTGVLHCGKPGCDGYLAGRWVMQKTGGKPGRPKAGQRKEPHSGQVAHAISYACKSCRGVAIRAEHIEPLMYREVCGRLAKGDAKDLLRAEIHDAAQAEAIRAELGTLYAEVETIGIERGQGLLTGQQAKIATDIVSEKIAKLERRQEDQELVRVFDGIPLGGELEDVTAAIVGLSPDRLRRIIGVLMVVTIAPVGKGSHVFDPNRVGIDWLR